ncbi:unnamed protein product [Phaedon cochleariae]|uniref:Uncharacterized protein n=1 Tax=Phaedon cochleariae TaxID=80249 RepID=A0A9P0DUJ3_PHACE|nr:unnamed protein product [Phaedon cochleariae]
MNNSKLLLLARACQRQITRNVATTEVSGPRVERLKNLQKKMQIDDGELVHLKNGFGDKALYQFTLLLTLIGLGLSADTLIKLTLGKK